MIDDFRRRTAVITGAASGLGLAFARAAAAEGMRLVLADVEAGALARAADELGATADVIAVPTDVSDADQVEALAAAARARFDAVHLLFNNAGVATSGLAWECTPRDWEWTLGVNLWGVIHGLRAFVPAMLADAAADPAYRGHVVNTASMAGLVNMPLTAVYNASKHAVVALSETLHHDLSLVTAQVRCSVVCPYFVPTGIHQSARNRPDHLADGDGPTAAQRICAAMIEKAIAAGRVSAQDVARMTFAAIREGRHYVFSHPNALAPIARSTQAIVEGANPPDPYAERPHLRAQLEAALAAGGRADGP